MHATFQGWVGALVQDERRRLSDDASTLAGVLAGAIAVSEAYQHCLGDPEAGRRDVGLSLWKPDSDWHSEQAVGPRLQYLPTRTWLLGLGHLGQGYSWSLGLLPYAQPGEVRLFLMDTDSVVAGNVATGLLARRGDIGRPKTRLVSALLEGLGIDSRIVERRFDEAFRLQGDEPRLALAGFDDPAPRRLIGDRFSHVVDIGLGGGPVEYLDMLIHSFPSELDPSTAFPAEKATRRPLRSAYQAEIGRLIEAGVDEGEARCGITEVAGISVGAAFVGAIAGALGVVDVLRYLHGGPDFSVVSLDLRSPNDMRSASNENPGAFGNLGYCLTRD